jgi:hypothetical protein
MIWQEFASFLASTSTLSSNRKTNFSSFSVGMRFFLLSSTHNGLPEEVDNGSPAGYFVGQEGFYSRSLNAAQFLGHFSMAGAIGEYLFFGGESRAKNGLWGA